MSTARGASMDAINLDDEWELLPDHKSFFFVEERCSNGGGHGDVGGMDQLLLGAKLVVINMDHFRPASHPPPYHCIPDEEAKKPLLLPSEDGCGRDPAAEFKDIGVVPAEPERSEIVPKVTEILISDAEDEDEMIKCASGVKEVDEDEVLVEAADAEEETEMMIECPVGAKAVDQDDALVVVEAAAADGHQCVRGEEGIDKTGFSVGNLKVNGVGALCSFGVAAATFCILLLGGKQQQQQQKRQNHKIQQQMYAGDERIRQVVQQASRLNQTMSSVMGGASSARASISFGGYYQGF